MQRKCLIVSYTGKIVVTLFLLNVLPIFSSKPNLMTLFLPERSGITPVHHTTEQNTVSVEHRQLSQRIKKQGKKPVQPYKRKKQK